MTHPLIPQFGGAYFEHRGGLHGFVDALRRGDPAVLRSLSARVGDARARAIQRASTEAGGLYNALLAMKRETGGFANDCAPETGLSAGMAAIEPSRQDIVPFISMEGASGISLPISLDAGMMKAPFRTMLENSLFTSPVAPLVQTAVSAAGVATVTVTPTQPTRVAAYVVSVGPQVITSPANATFQLTSVLRDTYGQILTDLGQQMTFLMNSNVARADIRLVPYRVVNAIPMGVIAEIGPGGTFTYDQYVQDVDSATDTEAPIGSAGFPLVVNFAGPDDMQIVVQVVTPTSPWLTRLLENVRCAC